MTRKCHFCGIGTSAEKTASHDRPFLEADSYFAIPSIGGFVEGWSLVCPREHVYNLKDHYKEPSFIAFVRSAAQRVMSHYGPVVMFEHGSSHAGSLTSCGTDHGHLHIVPLHISLADALIDSERKWKEQRASLLVDLPDSAEYLFYTEDVMSENPVGLVHLLSAPISQFFRRLIAASLKQEEQSDYRRFPLLSLASRTQNTLARLS